MPPNTPKPTPSGESIIVALMEQIEGMRRDVREQTESLSKKLDSQTESINRKLDAQASEARSEFKELRDDVADMRSRLAEGSERMRNLRREIDEAKSRCVAVHPSASTTALEKRADSGTESSRKKRPMPWWLPLLIGGALAFVGERAAKVFFNAMADPPSVPSLPPPASSSKSP